MSVDSVRSWLGAHVEAAVLHAAIELQLLPSLLNHDQSCAELAERHHFNQYGIRVLLNLLSCKGIVTKSPDGVYGLRAPYKTTLDQQTMVAIASSQQGWQKLSQFSFPVYDSLLTSAQTIPTEVGADKAHLLEWAWTYVWSIGIMEMGKRHLFSMLDEHPHPFSELATRCKLSEEELRRLCQVGEHVGLLSCHDDLVELTLEARMAFGKGSMKGYCRWMEQRLMMECNYFFSPLGMLGHCIENLQAVSLSSSLGSPANSQFRRTFVRINRPLIPLLYHTAQKVVRAVNLTKQSLRFLEIGAGLGSWGIALASAHPKSHLVAVDTSETLIETQQVVAATRVDGQYTWIASDMLHIELPHHQFDVIVLNEICHTVSPEALSSWLEQIVQLLSPDGLLLIADMVLDENYTSPPRHLLSAVKLLVTGGGQVLSINDYRRLLCCHGLNYVQLHRLTTTDLIVASTKLHELGAAMGHGG